MHDKALSENSADRCHDE